MCSIFGVFSENINKYKNKIDDIILSTKHRGPDFSHHTFSKKHIFAHNRLSIIDINNRSSQPYTSNDKNFEIVFNGEIYNYLELKKELSKFYDFKTSSDTEVLLASYLKWGIDSLQYLNGAFAFCIYDKKNNKSFFARDRFGQKPIFFWKKDDDFLFSSEIKSFFKCGYSAEPNMGMWRNYLTQAETDNSRETFFKDIFQLLPGEYATFNNSTLQIKNWYNLSDRVKQLENSNINYNELTTRLSKSVELCLRADASQGISLSGGLDSNILLYLSLNILEKNIDTYSVEFGKSFSEKELFEKSVKKYQVKNDLVDYNVSDFIKNIQPLIWHLESPAGGIMNGALSKLAYSASKDNKKIIQDGTGLDEIFGGYEIHHLYYLFELFEHNSKYFEYHFQCYLNKWNRTAFETKNKLENLKKNNFKTIDGFSVFNNTVLNKDFLNINSKLNSADELNKKISLKDSLIDYLQSSKIPRNNRLKDRSSMAFGVELRLPFLDHNLVEFGLSLPSRLYFMKGSSKSILREIFKNKLDESVRINKKISIQSPQNVWFKELGLKEYFSELINSESFKNRGIFNHKKVNMYWNEYLNKKKDTSFLLWQILNTEEWFRVFIDNKPNKKFIFEY